MVSAVASTNISATTSISSQRIKRGLVSGAITSSTSASANTISTASASTNIVSIVNVSANIGYKAIISGSVGTLTPNFAANVVARSTIGGSPFRPTAGASPTAPYKTTTNSTPLKPYKTAA